MFALLTFFSYNAYSQEYPEYIQVDKKIVFVIDASASMDMKDFNWQIDGYYNGFKAAEVKRSIENGYFKKIAVIVIQFSDFASITQSWTIVTPENVDDFAETFKQQQRIYSGSTGLGMGLDAARVAIQKSNIESSQTIIFVSGDGVNNTGIDPYPLNEQISKYLKVTIVGVPFLDIHATGLNKELDSYYNKYVVYGPGSFVLLAESKDDFTKALVKTFTINN